MPKHVLAETTEEQAELTRILDQALAEDLGSGDVTTACLVPASVEVRAKVIAKQSTVLAGGSAMVRLLHKGDATLVVRHLVEEGEVVKEGTAVLEIEGRAQAILTAERVGLNILGRCSGIATLTSRFVDAVKRWDVKILDTRKTTPGLRLLERYAVRVGGGENHRMGLYDQVLIKDNHHRVLERLPKGTLVQKVQEFRKTHPGILVEIEVEEPDMLDTVLQAKPDIILLDNMDPDTVSGCVQKIGKDALTEVSGGIGLDNIAAYARTGVNRISIGALTHSVEQSDFSLRIESPKELQ